MAKKLQFGTGSVRVEMTDELDAMYRRAIEDVAPGILDEIETATKEVYDGAVKVWPDVGDYRSTGKSKAGLDWHVRISPDQDKISGHVVNTVNYARYVKPRKLRRLSAVTELIRKPMRRRGVRIADDLAARVAATLSGD